MDLTRNRRSIRKYKPSPIEKEKLDRILEAGRLAPSAANKQPWHFIIVTDERLRRSLREAYDQDWFVSAPVILIVCADPNVSWQRTDGEEYWKVDAAIAMQNMICQAWDEGIGSCWIAAFNESPAKEILHIPDHIRVAVMTPLGYPDETKGEVTNRKPKSDITHYDGW